MKIIKPIDLTGAGVVESNAPDDQFPAWQPIGRDFAIDFTSMAAHAEGDTLAVADTGVGGAGDDKLRVYQLSTGNRILIQAEVWGRLYEVRVSPDEQYLVLRGTVIGASGAIHLYSLATGNRLFSKVDLPSQSIPPVKSRIRWLRDSSRFFYIDSVSENNGQSGFENSRSYRRFVSVDPATGNEFALSPYSILRQSPVRGSGSGISEWGYLVDILEYEVTSSGFIFCVLTDQWPESSDRRISTARIDAATGAGGYFVSEFAAAFGSYPTDGFVVCPNPDRDQVVMCYATSSFREIIVLEDNATLAVASVNPFSSLYDGTILTGIHYGAVQKELVFSKTTGVRHHRFSSLDLSDAGDLDSIIGPTPGFVLMSDNYYVYFKETGGYGLVDSTTNQVVAQVNPTVTAGDIYTYANHNYEALQDNNDRPDLGTLNVDAEGNADPTWLDLGFINPLRMFDEKLDSRTTAPSPLVIDVTPGMLVNGLALFNVDAATVQITYTDPTDGLVYDTGQISMLDNSGVQDWYSFFFDPYLVKSDLARVDLPAYIDGTIQITLDGAGADVSIGEVVLGTIYQIGDAQYGSSAGIIDFSRKEADQFGNFEIVPRRFSKRAEFDTVIPPAYGGSVQRTLASLRATPIVWIGSVDLEETIVYGYFREFDILLSNPAFSNVTITVEGL